MKKKNVFNEQQNMVLQKMNALYSSRQNYIASGSNVMNRRALKHNTHTYANVVYTNKDKVYYHRKKLKV